MPTSVNVHFSSCQASQDDPLHAFMLIIIHVMTVGPTAEQKISRL